MRAALTCGDDAAVARMLHPDVAAWMREHGPYRAAAERGGSKAEAASCDGAGSDEMPSALPPSGAAGGAAGGGGGGAPVDNDPNRMQVDGEDP